MNKRCFFVLLFLLGITGVEAQTKLIEKFEKPPIPGMALINYSKYQLDNGLTLIVTEDHSDPIVHVDVTYHVGSSREDLGHSGFAHFFEHMMFQGSKHVADEEHFKIVTQAGGTMNGTTNRDRTNYFETVPSNYLETALWLESDRMGFLLDAVTQQKFEVQRATVKNEKGQRYENRPYGMTGEIVDRNLYPFAHPYAWPTIGYIDDLNRVNVDDLKKFFLRWYGPNNAVLTIGGDVKTGDVVKLVEKYFGAIPRGPEVKRPKSEYYYLDKDRYVSYEDNVRFPMLQVVFPSVPNFHEDEAALDILAEILGQGKASILYQDFVKTNKAVSASVYNSGSEQAGEFTFSIRSYPGTKLADMQALLTKSLDNFEKRGVTDDDLLKAKASVQANALFSLESISGKVSRLAQYETFLGTPNYFSADLQRYERVTKGDVLRVYYSYVKAAKGLYLSIYPKGGKDLIAAPDNYKFGGDSTKVTRNNYDTIKTRTIANDASWRKRPKAGKTPVVKAPTPFKYQRPNGMKIITAYNNEVADYYFQFNVKCGQVKQPKGKEGIAYLLSRMLQESTYKFSAEQLETEFEKLGTDVNVYPTEEDIVITIHALKKNMMPSLDLLHEMMQMPKFDKEEFEREKKQQIELIANQSTQADAMANETFNRLLYGADHPLGNSIYGTLASVRGNAQPNQAGVTESGITLEDVKQYYQQNFIPLNTTVMVSGDLDQDDVQQIQMAMEGWPPSPMTTQLNLPQTPTQGKTKIYLVNKDKAPQSEIRVGYLSLPYDATGDFYKANIMNYVLGGAFNSRINLKLREEKGWTYGARSYFSGTHYPGPWRVATGVKAQFTDSSLYEIINEIKKYRENGVSKEELEFTKNSILDREALRYETNAQKAGFIEKVLEYNLPDDYLKQQANILGKMKRKDIKNLAEKYLPLENMVIVVVGDAKKYKAGLEKLGYEVEDVKAYSSMKNE